MILGSNNLPATLSLAQKSRYFGMHLTSCHNSNAGDPVSYPTYNQQYALTVQTAWPVDRDSLHAHLPAAVQYYPWCGEVVQVVIAAFSYPCVAVKNI